MKWVNCRRCLTINAACTKRFSVAFVVYACAALLLVGGVTLLPKVLDHRNPVGAQPGDQSEAHSDRLSNQTEPFEEIKSNVPHQQGWLPDDSPYKFGSNSSEISMVKLLKVAFPYECQQASFGNYYVMTLNDLVNLDERALIDKITRGIHDFMVDGFDSIDMTVTLSVAYQPIQKSDTPSTYLNKLGFGTKIEQVTQLFGHPLVECKAENFKGYTAKMIMPANICESVNYEFTNGTITLYKADSVLGQNLSDEEKAQLSEGFSVRSGEKNIVKYAPYGEDLIIFYGVFASSVSCEDIEALITPLACPVDLNF